MLSVDLLTFVPQFLNENSPNHSPTMMKDMLVKEERLISPRSRLVSRTHVNPCF